MSSLVTFLQRTPPLIQDIEYRKAVRHNAFYAKDLIALLVAEGRPHCLVSAVDAHAAQARSPIALQPCPL